MAYNGKTNWVNNDIVGAADMNRIERGILDTEAAVATHKTAKASHPKTAKFIIGTSTAGWTAADCDYLCDGSGDQVELRAAITALPATGGEIFILDGTYNISGKLDITTNNVSIIGNGSSTILRKSSNTGAGVINILDSSYCSIKNLQIDGRKNFYKSEGNHGISLSSSFYTTIANVICNNNFSHGIHISSSSDTTITNVICNENGDSGIYAASSPNNIITNSICNNNTTDGIRISSNCNTVIGNICNNNANGILLNAANDSSVTGNVCHNNSYGIKFMYANQRNTITSNVCIRGTGQPSDYDSTQYTIRLDGVYSNYNLIGLNNCMGKDVVTGQETNTVVNNKFD